MRKLRKVEMYNAIIKKYPSLKALDMGGYNRNGINRDELWAILIEFKIDKRLTKEQKEMVKHEKNIRILKECEKNGE